MMRKMEFYSKDWHSLMMNAMVSKISFSLAPCLAKKLLRDTIVQMGLTRFITRAHLQQHLQLGLPTRFLPCLVHLLRQPVNNAVSNTM